MSTSAGKDSQTMLRKVVELAKQAGVLDRVVAVHADLGREEWDGVPELAEEQAGLHGVRFEKVRREQGGILDHITERHESLKAKGKHDAPPWPSSAARWCTSDHKRAQIRKVMTKLAREHAEQLAAAGEPKRPCLILDCQGLRAQESACRKKKIGHEFEFNGPASTKTTRHVWTWLPILDWTLDEVWADIHDSGIPYHPVYDEGMPRLSCSFCVLASKSALVRAAQLRPELAEEYAAKEVEVGFTFKSGQSIREIIDEAAATSTAVEAEDWAA